MSMGETIRLFDETPSTAVMHESMRITEALLFAAAAPLSESEIAGRLPKGGNLLEIRGLAGTSIDQSIHDGIAAGVACFEHGTFLDDETATEMAGAGVALVPTLAITRVAVERWRELGIDEEMLPRFSGIEEAMAGSIKLAHAAGIPIGSGSDIFGPAQDRWGLELALKARILGPMEAIVSATGTNAKIIRRADDLGTVETGKSADLIAVGGNPLSDPELFDDPANVTFVMKNGRVEKNTVGT